MEKENVPPPKNGTRSYQIPPETLTTESICYGKCEDIDTTEIIAEPKNKNNFYYVEDEVFLVLKRDTL